MNRSALRTFIRRLVAATLAVAPMAGCRTSLLDDPHALVTSDGGGDLASSCPFQVVTPPGSHGDCENWKVQVQGCLDGGVGLDCKVACGPVTGSIGSAYCSIPAPVPGTGIQTVQCSVACPGRTPAGLVFDEAETTGDELGDYFASAARLEAASVHAFRTLGDELRAHGAPRSLVRASERAARDEIRHAEVMTSLARRRGAKVVPPRVVPVPVRSLEAIAIENAVEGCVRESFGAILATFQSRAATDPAVRAAMTRIADDETRHAELSWQVAHWVEPRLTLAQRRSVDSARERAAQTLLTDASAALHAPWMAPAGLPDAAKTRALAEGFIAFLG